MRLTRKRKLDRNGKKIFKYNERVKMFEVSQSIVITNVLLLVYEVKSTNSTTQYASYKYQYSTLLPTTQPNTILNRYTEIRDIVLQSLIQKYTKRERKRWSF